MQKPASYQPAAPPKSAMTSVVATASLEAKLVEAEQRAEKAERERVCLDERARLLEQRAHEAERSSKQLAARASEAEARVARAEGRAEVLAETAQSAAAALERAARAEERVRAMGDLQTSLPSLITAVVGALSQQSAWYQASPSASFYGAAPIKLEFDESRPESYDHRCMELLEGACSKVGSGSGGSHFRPETYDHGAKSVSTGYAGSKGSSRGAEVATPGLMQRAVGALKGASGGRR